MEALTCIDKQFRPFKDDITPKSKILYAVLHQEPEGYLKNLLQKQNISFVYLFGIIPFLKIKKKANQMKIYLFGFIPIVKIKEKK